MLLGVALLISAALAFYVAAPLLSAEGAGDGTLPIDVTPLADLKRRRLVVYENLKDLEFEFQAGKIAPEDYQALRADYMAEAAQLMIASQQEEQMASEGELVERAVAARRAQRKSAAADDYVCPKCGFENPLPVKFCGECGAKIAPRPRK
jgi:zinc ribbon protein